MGRRYADHHRRRVEPLDGVWAFRFLGDVSPDAVQVANLEFDDVMAVPGCFDASFEYAGRRGLAAYRRELNVAAPGKFRLEVGAAHHDTWLFLDGALVGEHHSGFTRFCVDFELPRPEATLIVLVDNRLGPENSPLHGAHFDWYHYGGITRSVRLHQLPDAYIDQVAVRTLSLEPARVGVRCRYRSSVACDAPFAIRCGGEIVHHAMVSLHAPGGQLELELELPPIPVWSPSTPHLEVLELMLGDDDHRVRFGLRSVEVRGRDLLLNGERLQLRGLNRHEAHPDFGHAVPAAVQLGDLARLRDLGCNVVRGSHYPQDPTFLDLCDEVGMLVFCEAIGWQQPLEQLCDPAYIDAQVRHIDAMIDMAQNHPSVIIWGILNESASHEPEARAAYQQLLGHIKQRDPTRPVTYATRHAKDDALYDLCDLVTINTYPGWYYDDLDGIADDLDGTLRAVTASAPDKPILVGEIGAGALYGFRDQHRGHWSEDFQAELLDRVLSHLLRPESGVSGVCIWQYCDCRTSDAIASVMRRPRGFNNKGIVDEYRRPKLAYQVVKQRFRQS